MRRLGSLGICLALSFGSCGVTFAQGFDDETRCEVAAHIMDSAAPGKTHEMLDYIIGTMRAIDRAHGDKGRPEILPKMTSDGQTAVALAAASRCRDHLNMTVEDIALETYQGMRAMQSSLGFGETQRVQASHHSMKRYSKVVIAPRPKLSRTVLQSVNNDLRWLAFQ